MLKGDVKYPWFSSSSSSTTSTSTSTSATTTTTSTTTTITTTTTTTTTATTTTSTTRTTTVLAQKCKPHRDKSARGRFSLEFSWPSKLAASANLTTAVSAGAFRTVLLRMQSAVQ